MDAINLLTIITIAFLGSFSHCVGMCGGIVVAYSSTKIDDKVSKLNQILSHLFYSFGRVLTYTILGAIFGYIGGVATFNNYTNGTLLVIAGVLMILTGLSLLGKVKFLTLIEHTFSKSKWYQDSFRTFLRSKSLGSFFMLGMLNGLLPCGFVYFFAITAASTASPFWGALVMLLFGLSTIPAMFGMGFFVGFLKQSSTRNLILKLASLTVIAYGIFTIYNGYNFITDPNRSLLHCH
ncbi:MAG: sulfite exporter TauE/SafE family protein [Sulfurospirillum sp.]|nr:MAG: sulfite exporter TauE/SafE family protein [Sulfurospirillum sp.]